MSYVKSLFLLPKSNYSTSKMVRDGPGLGWSQEIDLKLDGTKPTPTFTKQWKESQRKVHVLIMTTFAHLVNSP